MIEFASPLVLIAVVVQLAGQASCAGLPKFPFDQKKAKEVGNVATAILYEATLTCLKTDVIEEAVKRAACEVGATYVSNGQYTANCASVAEKVGEQYADCMNKEVQAKTQERIVKAFGITPDPPGSVPTPLDLIVTLGADLVNLDNSAFSKLPGLPELLRDFTERMKKTTEAIQSSKEQLEKLKLGPPPSEADATKTNSYMSYLSKVKIGVTDFKLKDLLNGLNFVKDKTCDILWDIGKQQFFATVETGPLKEIGGIVQGFIKKDKEAVDESLKKAATEKDVPVTENDDHVNKVMEDAESGKNKEEVEKLEKQAKLTVVKIKPSNNKEEDIKAAAKQAILSCAALFGSDDMHLLFCHNQFQKGKHEHIEKLISLTKEYGNTESEEAAKLALQKVEAALTDFAKTKLFKKGKAFAECIDDKSLAMMPNEEYKKLYEKFDEDGSMHRKVKMDLCGWSKIKFLLNKWQHDFIGRPWRKVLAWAIKFKDPATWKAFFLKFYSDKAKDTKDEKAKQTKANIQ